MGAGEGVGVGVGGLVFEAAEFLSEALGRAGSGCCHGGLVVVDYIYPVIKRVRLREREEPKCYHILYKPTGIQLYSLEHPPHLHPTTLPTG